MDRRIKMRNIFERVLGSKNIYFQSPADIQMSYPAIKYELKDRDIRKADNINYTKQNSYSVTVIDPNPDTGIPDELEESFSYIRFDRHYKADNLNHYVYEIYF